MAYTIAVPDVVFNAEDGMDRWLLRQAMIGWLPDAVRLNVRRGRQSADLAGRLLASARRGGSGAGGGGQHLASE